MTQKKNPGKLLTTKQVGGEVSIPPEFVAAMERQELSQKEPTDVNPEVLSGTIVESRVEQKETDERRRVTVKKKAGNITLSATNTNDQGQSVQIVRTMRPTTDPITGIVNETTNVTVKDLGNGWSLEEVGVTGAYSGDPAVFTPGIFEDSAYGAERPDVVPERFRATVPATTEATNSAGTAFAPTLSTGDLAKSEKQVTEYVKRTETTTRNNGSLPTLAGQNYDARLNVVIPYTEQVVASGAAAGHAHTDVTPLSAAFDLAKVFDPTAVATLFAAFHLVFPGTTSLQFPDEMTGVALSFETHSGEGAANGSGTGSWTGHGSWTVPISQSTQASQSVMPVFVPTIKQKWGRNVPTTRVMVLLPMPVSADDVLTKISAVVGTVTAWPKFNPAEMGVKLVGQSVSIRVEATNHVQSGGSIDSAEYAESGGTSYSVEVGMTIRTERISATIHGNFASGFLEATSTPGAMSLTAAANAGGAYPQSITKDSIAPQASYSISNVGATVGATSVPTTGKRLLSVEAEPYQFGYAMIHAEVVDFATL